MTPLRSKPHSVADMLVSLRAIEAARRINSASPRRWVSAFPAVVDFEQATATCGAMDAPSRQWRCSHEFSVAGAPNGGYLMAAAARAACQALGETEHLQPVALTAWFLQPARPVLYNLTPTVLKSTKRTSVVTVAATEANGIVGGTVSATRPTFVVTTSLGDPQQVPVPSFKQHAGSTMPVLPDPESCQSLLGLFPGLSDSNKFPIFQRHDARFDPAYVRETASIISTRSGGVTSDRLRDDLETSYDCWIRFPPVPVEASASDAGAVDGHSDKLRVPGAGRSPHRPLDSLSLLFFCDCLPPPALLAILPRFTWIPTIEMSVQIRGKPTPDGWLALRHTTRHITGGKLEADCELWDAQTGELVCLSRQFAMLLDPRRQ